MRADPCQVVIVGGGPAGLAAAIESARRGLATVVLERSPGPPDKACGEGVLPRGVRWLESRGVTRLLSPADCSAFASIRWVEPEGSVLEGRLPAPGGLGVRRIALTAALARRAVECGAEVRFASAVRAVQWTPEGVVVETDSGTIRAEIAVAADGLHSGLRRAAGLDRPPRGPRRFGLRRHYRVRPWSDAVEVHLGEGVEAFVTPAGERRVGVAFLWEPGALEAVPDCEALLARFPLFGARLAGAEPDSRPRGAGPMAQGCRRPVADRLALVGDAAGFVDAVTGEGLALGFAAAAALGECLPRALAAGATRAALAPYARAHAREFRRYALLTRALLALARRPGLRRALGGALRLAPPAVDRLMAAATA